MSDDLAAVEAALAGLTPCPTSLDRDRLMFLAGQSARAAVRRRRVSGWAWPLAAAAGWILALGLGVMSGLPGPRGVGPAEYVALPADSAPSVWAVSPQTPDDSLRREADYLRIRRLVLEGGADVLPRPSVDRAPRPGVPGTPRDRDHLLRDLLEG